MVDRLEVRVRSLDGGKDDVRRGGRGEAFVLGFGAFVFDWFGLLV